MVSITVSNGNAVQVPWTSEMNAQTALELAYSSVFFGVSYYGSVYGYFVVMLNNVYDSPSSGYYWEFFLNGVSSNKGIDNTVLNDGDAIAFSNTQYNELEHKGTALAVKHQHAHSS